jgi:hypothetical protein
VDPIALGWQHRYSADDIIAEVQPRALEPFTRRLMYFVRGIAGEILLRPG